METTLRGLLEKYYSKTDVAQIDRAINLATTAHSGQERKSGEPYIIHPLAVAEILAELQFDRDTIIAGLLHDLPEDTNISVDEIRRQFGRSIAELVDGVTKLSNVRLKRTWFGFGRAHLEELPAFERQVATLQKMFLATSKDIRVIIIKLADRLHNMRTLQFLSPEKQIPIASETLDIYAPIADRLGIGQWKGELEDLAFPYVYPKESKELEQTIGKELKRRKNDIDKNTKSLMKLLAKEGIRVVDIHGRIKRRYSLWCKLKKHQNDIRQIYDLVALRIIVKNDQECYEALSIIHKHWRPIPNRIKDYIAFPKPNGYRSIHTTVLGPGGKVVEIQIRDVNMHREAERGIAAHWSYKDTNLLSRRFRFLTRSNRKSKDYTQWFEELTRWEKELSDPKEYKKQLSLDFFRGRIFVFTPQGDVKSLPASATPVDFAYAVHSYLGDHCVGAKVNGKMVKLDYELHNADVIEIIANDKSKGPSNDWLTFVKSSQARNRIKHFIKNK